MVPVHVFLQRRLLGACAAGFASVVRLVDHEASFLRAGFAGLYLDTRPHSGGHTIFAEKRME